MPEQPTDVPADDDQPAKMEYEPPVAESIEGVDPDSVASTPGSA